MPVSLISDGLWQTPDGRIIAAPDQAAAEAAANFSATPAEADADIAAVESANRADALRAECKRRIEAVASVPTQLNLVGAQMFGALTQPDQAAFAQGYAWIQAMRAEWQAAATEDREPVWPEPPAAAVELASRY